MNQKKKNMINSLEQQIADAFKALEMGVTTMDPVNLDYASFLYEGLKKRIENLNGTDDLLNLARGGEYDTYALQTVIGRSTGLLKLQVEREGDIYCSKGLFRHTEPTMDLAKRIPTDTSIPFWEVQSVAISVVMDDNKLYTILDLMWNVRREAKAPEGYSGYHAILSAVAR